MDHDNAYPAREQDSSVWVALGRQRVGKTAVLNAAIQYFRALGIVIEVWNADQQNLSHSLSTFFQDAAEPPTKGGPADGQRWLEEQFVGLGSGRRHVCLDVGGGQTGFAALVEEVKVLSTLERHGIGVIGLFCVGPEQADLDYLQRFSQNGMFLPKKTVIVLNAGLVLSGRSATNAFAAVMQSEVVMRAADNGAQVIVFPNLTCMSEVTDRGILFADAAAGRVRPGQKPLSMFDPTRVNEWWTERFLLSSARSRPTGCPHRRPTRSWPSRRGRDAEMKKVNRSHAKPKRVAPSKARVRRAPEGWAALMERRAASPPSFDQPDLAWRLVRRARHEESTLGRGSYWRVLNDVLRAKRVVLTRRFAQLTEDLRTEDLGVTVTTTERASLPAGLSWWEWDARLPGRITELRPNEMDCDRTGVLALTDESGRRGTMHFVAGVVGCGGGGAEILPFAAHFDWREDFEPLPTIVPRPRPRATRHCRSRPANTNRHPEMAEHQQGCVRCRFAQPVAAQAAGDRRAGLKRRQSLCS
jgi:hypothetical protein